LGAEMTLLSWSSVSWSSFPSTVIVIVPVHVPTASPYAVSMYITGSNDGMIYLGSSTYL